MNVPIFNPLRFVGFTTLATSVLIILNQMYGYMINDPEHVVQLANTPPVILYSSLNVVAFFLLLVSLVGLYGHQARVTGRFGFMAFLVALFGSMLVSGDVWFETFVVPMVAQHAPALVGASHPIFIVGAFLTFTSFSLGWFLVGMASFRARVFPRGAAILLMLGAVVGFLPLTTPRLVVLALAIGWMGYALLTDKTDERRDLGVAVANEQIVG